MTSKDSLFLFHGLVSLFRSCVTWFETLVAKTHTWNYYIAGFAIFTVVFIFIRPIVGVGRAEAIRQFLQSDYSSPKFNSKVSLNYQDRLPPGRK